MCVYADDSQVMPRRLQPGQRAEVWIAVAESGSTELVYSTDHLLLEAPNWAPDGSSLLLNGDGLLWRLNLGAQAELKRVSIADLPPINNDHVIDAKRSLIYLSANDGHIYVAPVEGGTAKRVTHDSSRNQFLHGVSRDGATLAFVELPRADFRFPVGSH
jgi:TolB protein